MYLIKFSHDISSSTLKSDGQKTSNQRRKNIFLKLSSCSEFKLPKKVMKPNNKNDL